MLRMMREEEAPLLPRKRKARKSLRLDRLIITGFQKPSFVIWQPMSFGNQYGDFAVSDGSMCGNPTTLLEHAGLYLEEAPQFYFGIACATHSRTRTARGNNWAHPAR
jgi:hypothetical protein